MTRSGNDTVDGEGMFRHLRLLLWTVAVAGSNASCSRVQERDPQQSLSSDELLVFRKVSGAASSETADGSFTASGFAVTGWSPYSFEKVPKRTEYDVVWYEGAQLVVEARAQGAASALRRMVDVDPAKSEWLEWEWKVLASVPGADCRLRPVLRRRFSSFSALHSSSARLLRTPRPSTT